MVAGSVVSGGGVTALLVKILRKKKSEKSDRTKVEKE